MLSVENVFYQASSTGETDKLKAKAIKRRSTIMHPSSDHLSLLAVFNSYHDYPSQRSSFCSEYYLNSKALTKAV